MINLKDLELAFQPNKIILVLMSSMKLNPMRHFRAEITEMFKDIEWVRFNLNAIELSNNSAIYFISYRSMAIRGIHPDMIIYDNSHLFFDSLAFTKVKNEILSISKVGYEERYWRW